LHTKASIFDNETQKDGSKQEKCTGYIATLLESEEVFQSEIPPDKSSSDKSKALSAWNICEPIMRLAVELCGSTIPMFSFIIFELPHQLVKIHL
jgi:hypothetical protein